MIYAIHKIYQLLEEVFDVEPKKKSLLKVSKVFKDGGREKKVFLQEKVKRKLTI